MDKETKDTEITKQSKDAKPKNQSQNKSKKKEFFLLKALKAIGRFIIGFVPAIVGFVSGVIEGFKEIRKERLAAKQYKSTLSDKESFMTLEEKTLEMANNEIEAVSKQMEELHPNHNIGRGQLSEVIETVKATGLHYNLTAEYEIPLTLALKDGKVVAFKNTVQEKSKEAIQKIIDVIEEQKNLGNKGEKEPVGQDTREAISDRIQSAVEDKCVVKFSTDTHFFQFNGRTGELTVDDNHDKQVKKVDFTKTQSEHDEQSKSPESPEQNKSSRTYDEEER